MQPMRNHLPDRSRIGRNTGVADVHRFSAKHLIGLLNTIFLCYGAGRERKQCVNLTITERNSVGPVSIGG